MCIQSNCGLQNYRMSHPIFIYHVFHTLKHLHEIFPLLHSWIKTLRDDFLVWGFTVKNSLQSETRKLCLKTHTDGSLLFYKASKEARGKPHFLRSRSMLTCDYMINISHTSWIHSSKKMLNWFHWKWWFFFLVENVFFWILRMQPFK